MSFPRHRGRPEGWRGARRAKGGWAGVGASLPLFPGIASVGMLYGASATEAGMPPWSVVLTSLLVATGTAQLMALELLSQGVAWWLVVLVGLLINLRFAVFALHLGGFAAHLPLHRRWLYYGLVNDEGYAMTAPRVVGDRHAGSAELRWSAAVMFVVWLAWQVGTLAGAWVGPRFPSGLGLEVAVPLTLLTVLLLLASSRHHLVVAGVAAAVGLLLRGVPFGLGLIAGIAAGVATGLFLARWLREVGAEAGR